MTVCFGTCVVERGIETMVNSAIATPIWRISEAAQGDRQAGMPTYKATYTPLSKKLQIQDCPADRVSEGRPRCSFTNYDQFLFVTQIGLLQAMFLSVCVTRT